MSAELTEGTEMKAWKILVLVLAIAFVLRALPLSFGYFSDPDSFFHARNVELLVSGQAIPGLDPVSQQGRVYPNPPLFHTTYAAFAILSGLDMGLMLKLLSIIFALATVLLVYLMALERLGRRAALLSAFALSIMVLHVFRTAAFPRPDALGLLLLALGILAFLWKERLLCGIAAIAIALVNPIPTGLAFVLALLAFWGVRAVKRQGAETKATIAVVAVFALAYGLWLLNFLLRGIPWQAFYSQMSLEAAEMQNPTMMWYVSTLSFAWIFAVFGFAKARELLVRAWAAMTIAFSIFATRFTVFLTLPLAVLAGFGLKFFEEKTMEHRLAFYSLVVLLALVTSIPAMFQFSPYVSQPEGRAMEWLSSHAPNDSSVGSDWDQGDAIGYLGQRKVVVDGHFEFNPSVKERNDSIKIIAASSDCAKISAEAKKWGMNYYFVTQRDRESNTYKNGLLEAKCGFISKEYENGFAQILGFSE